MDALDEQHGCEAMAKIVEAHRRRTGRLRGFVDRMPKSI
jgi:hypothetical protein